MSQATKIEWTDVTWNPVRGCSRVSEGCRNCYAEKVAYRFSGPGQPYEGLVRIGADGARRPEWNGQIKFVEEHLLDPLKWKKPRRVFVNSMSDLFHENVTDAMLDRIFAVMALAPQHTFQVLTKRPERMLRYVTSGHQSPILDADSLAMIPQAARGARLYIADCLHRMLPVGEWEKGNVPWPLANVWLGVSVENQKAADERIPLLLETPAAVRFLSVEPLLGPVTFRWAKWDKWEPQPRRVRQLPSVERDGKLLAGSVDHLDGLRRIDWVIVGGESGPGARPMHPHWARALRDQCAEAGVPFFFKQWGEWKPICEMPEPEHRALYVPNKKAPEEWQQGEYDDVHGRRCTVAAEVMNFAGETGIERGFQQVDGYDGMTFFRVGKKAAGRMLDGREWNEFPAVRT